MRMIRGGVSGTSLDVGQSGRCMVPAVSSFHYVYSLPDSSAANHTTSGVGSPAFTFVMTFW